MAPFSAKGQNCSFPDDLSLGNVAGDNSVGSRVHSRAVAAAEEDDPDIIHFDNSSDLPLFASLNDLDNAALHIDGQSTVVDAPPDIIDVPDEDDDITDDEDALPHDLADSDVEDLINVDDDGVEKFYSSEEEED
ncbi:hypothetical protein Tco_0270513 [Tanacetum coccineum]